MPRPTSISTPVGRALAGSQVALGTKTVYHQPNGAFTGEISARCSSTWAADTSSGPQRAAPSDERDQRRDQPESQAALTAGLLPIVCVGERLEEREAGRTGDVIATQFAGSLAGLSGEQMAKVTIAYEPVWAIGTGKTATPEQAEEVHLDLRKLLTRRYNPQLAEAVRIQYGGSVNAKNAAELLAQPNIDGALVGGASLKADDFLAIIAAGAIDNDVFPDQPSVGAVRLNEVVMQVLFMILLFVVAVFMILLVLDPAGAWGRARRRLSAAWAVKARLAPRPATFLRGLPCASAAVWIILCAFATKCLNDDVSKLVVPGQAPRRPRRSNQRAPPAEPSGDAKPADTKPTDTKLPDPQPADAKPADPPSSESKATHSSIR